MTQSKDKNVLMVSYYYPPVGGVPPRRAARFACNLGYFGWKPVVLTVKNPSKREVVWDYEWFDELAKQDIPVLRTPWIDALGISDFFKRLNLNRLSNLSACFVRDMPPDEYIGWIPYGISAGLKAIKKHDMRLIYSNSFPFSAHIIAGRLKSKTGLPWVADFRDPWIDDPLRREAVYEWQRKIRKRQESETFMNADYIITASANYAEFICRKYNGLCGKVIVLYNGYDWEGAKNEPAAEKRAVMDITYAGAFYGPQSPASFLRVLNKLILNARLRKEDIRINIVGGYGNDTWKKEFTGSPVSEVVFETGFISNIQVRKQLLVADYLLLFQARERGNLIVVGKTFEYISVGRPIIALVPEESECASLLEKSGCLFGRADPDSAVEIEKVIITAYESWKKNKFKVSPRWDYIDRFSGTKLTGELASIFDKVTGQ